MIRLEELRVAVDELSRPRVEVDRRAVLESGEREPLATLVQSVGEVRSVVIGDVAGVISDRTENRRIDLRRGIAGED